MQIIWQILLNFPMTNKEKDWLIFHGAVIQIKRICFFALQLKGEKKGRWWWTADKTIPQGHDHHQSLLLIRYRCVFSKYERKVRLLSYSNSLSLSSTPSLSIGREWKLLCKLPSAVFKTPLCPLGVRLHHQPFFYFICSFTKITSLLFFSSSIKPLWWQCKSHAGYLVFFFLIGIVHGNNVAFFVVVDYIEALAPRGETAESYSNWIELITGIWLE